MADQGFMGDQTSILQRRRLVPHFHVALQVINERARFTHGEILHAVDAKSLLNDGVGIQAQTFGNGKDGPNLARRSPSHFDRPMTVTVVLAVCVPVGFPVCNSVGMSVVLAVRMAIPCLAVRPVRVVFVPVISVSANTIHRTLVAVW